ncbi:MAG TPA: hemerythrin domain-containing protein [Candidatus Saccharimonadia bacterium]|nr:hemerythrin domain-containing protein [Candidatus Saccharimonadia bacterium]
MFLASLRRSDTHALVLLKQDHRKVEKLFADFEDSQVSATRVRIAREICTELTVHAQLEENVLYPAALRALDREDDKLIREAAVEHRTVKQLIESINGTGAGDRLFEANVTVLMEYVKHHVREEEREMFPKLESSKLDLEALGARMLEEKTRLEQQLEARKRPASRTRVSVPSFGPPEASDRSVIPRDRPRGGKARAAAAKRPAKAARATRGSGKRPGAARNRAP